MLFYSLLILLSCGKSDSETSNLGRGNLRGEIAQTDFQPSSVVGYDNTMKTSVSGDVSSGGVSYTANSGRYDRDVSNGSFSYGSGNRETEMSGYAGGYEGARIPIRSTNDTRPTQYVGFAPAASYNGTTGYVGVHTTVSDDGKTEYIHLAQTAKEEIDDWQEFAVRYFLNENGMQTPDNKVKLLEYIRKCEENPFFGWRSSIKRYLSDENYPERKELIKCRSLDDHAKNVIAQGNNDQDYKEKMSLLLFCYFMKLGDKEIWDAIIGNPVFSNKMLSITMPALPFFNPEGKRLYEFYEIAIMFSNLDALKAILSVDGVRNSDVMVILCKKPQSEDDSQEFSTRNDLAIVKYLLEESKNYKHKNYLYQSDGIIIPSSGRGITSNGLRLINKYILDHNSKYRSLINF